MQRHPNKPTPKTVRRSGNANHAVRSRHLGHDEGQGDAAADGPTKDAENHHEHTVVLKAPNDGGLCGMGAHCNPKGGSVNVPT